MQGHVTVVALDEVFAALRQHPSISGIQEWGLILLSYLTQVTPDLLVVHIWSHNPCCLLLAVHQVAPIGSCA